MVGIALASDDDSTKVQFTFSTGEWVMRRYVTSRV